VEATLDKPDDVVEPAAGKLESDAGLRMLALLFG
jgi:hypothetical protein